MSETSESTPENIAPLLRLGLEEELPMEDPNATILVTAPTPRTGGSPGVSSRGWEPPSVEQLQKLLPQYEISAFIARGGMGAVYKGQQRTLRRPVAIKVLPPDLEDGDFQFSARFKHEAQAMAQLSHPNIVAVFDAGETPDGLLYFVMEFIEGTDVAQLIASEGQLDPLRAIQITTAVCEALAFAHEEGIIHRDIKPSNIMLDKRGRVKVADFGLAKTVNLEHSLQTQSNMAMGTPDFIAPEALMPGMKVDGRADIYAVGVMLYQMLTGHIPRGRFELPSGVVPQMNKGFDAVVDKAMQTDREKRYSTAMEMKSAVEKVGSGQARMAGTNKAEAVKPQSRKANAAATSLPPAQANRRPLIIAAAVAVLVFLSGLIYLAPWKKAGASGSAFPSGQWVAMKNELLKRGDVKEAADGWMQRIGDHYLKIAGFAAHNAGLRCRFQGTPSDRAKDSPRPTLREARPETHSSGFQLQFNNEAGHEWIKLLRLSAPDKRMFTLSNQPLQQAMGNDREFTLELYTIGDSVIARCDGQMFRATADQEPADLGTSAAFHGMNSDRFRDLELINLDGLSEAEALKLAGVDEKGNDLQEKTRADAAPRAGQRLLFDGKSFAGWHGLGTTAAPASWQIADGAVTGGDRTFIVTDEEFGDFDLSLEWRVGSGGNGGIFFLIPAQENDGRLDTHWPEFNLIDDATDSMNRSGSLFCVQESASTTTVKPVGAWNTARLVNRGGKVEHWVNEKLACAYDLNDAATRERWKSTKIGGAAGYASGKRGRIALQAWTGETSYRNVALKVAVGKPPASSARWTKVWQKPEDIPGHVAVTAGWASTKEGQMGIRVPAFSGKNGGVRARFRRSPDGTPAPQLQLRNAKGIGYNILPAYDAVFFRRNSAAASAGSLELKKMPLTLPKAGQEYVLEFIAIGQTLIARLDDQTASMQLDAGDHADLQGDAGLFQTDVNAFRDVEVINLDGLSEAEALKAAGVASTSASGQWLDLMPLIDPAKHALNGNWTVENGSLVCKASSWALCELPIDYHGGSYDLRYIFTRGAGQQLAMYFPFRKGDAAGDLIFDFFAQFPDGLKRAGLENLPGTKLGDPGSVFRLKPEWIPQGRKTTVVLKVRDEVVAATLNGAEVFRWQADWSQLHQKGGVEGGLFAKLNGRPVFGVGAFFSDVVYHSIEMREVSGIEGRNLQPAILPTLEAPPSPANEPAGALR